MAVDFPDVIPVRPGAQWATLCNTRSPKFKVHATKALALSAIAYKKPDYEIALYELKDEGWVKVWEYVHSDACDNCGGPFNIGRGYRHRYIGYVAKAKWSAPVICEKCEYGG